MISREELVEARQALLARTAAYFSQRPEVIGAFVAGSLAAGSADAYSDIDLRVVATPDGHTKLVAERLEAPAHWGDLLFNEWLDGAHHCVSHFRPFLKIDVFYLNVDSFLPSPWLKLPGDILLDRTGLIRDTIARSSQLPFPPVAPTEVSRVLSKALATAHEVVRRTRRGELVYAQSLLEELRSYVVRMEGWLHRGLVHRALAASYVPLNAPAIEGAVIVLSEVVAQQIPDLHRSYPLARSLQNDLHAITLVTDRQIE
jgi:predicted nucleotidyltransferase